jgi:hypothetical protein
MSQPHAIRLQGDRPVVAGQGYAAERASGRPKRQFYRGNLEMPQKAHSESALETFKMVAVTPRLLRGRNTGVKI